MDILATLSIVTLQWLCELVKPILKYSYRALQLANESEASETMRRKISKLVNASTSCNATDDIFENQLLTIKLTLSPNSKWDHTSITHSITVTLGRLI